MSRFIARGHLDDDPRLKEMYVDAPKAAVKARKDFLRYDDSFQTDRKQRKITQAHHEGRPICVTEGCGNFAAHAWTLPNGRKVYRRICQTCHLTRIADRRGGEMPKSYKRNPRTTQ